MQRFQKTSKKVLDKMSQNKKVVGAGTAVLTGANAMAAPLTAADVPMTDTIASITVVFLATLGVSVLIYGYRKITGVVK